MPGIGDIRAVDAGVIYVQVGRVGDLRAIEANPKTQIPSRYGPISVAGVQTDVWETPKLDFVPEQENVFDLPSLPDSGSLIKTVLIVLGVALGVKLLMD